MQPGANAVLLKIKRQLMISRATLDRELDRIERCEFQIDALLADPRQFVQTNCSGAEARRRLEMEAERGVTTVVRIGESQRMPGRIDVRIDNRLIALPIKLALLLEALALDSGVEPDRFVGWKTRLELWHVLAKRFPPEKGESWSPRRAEHVIHNLVTRLKKELTAQGLHHGIVERNRRLRSLRLRVVRQHSTQVG